MSTPLAALVMDRLRSTYREAADPERAAAMGRYLRDQFRFLGLMTAHRRALSRQVLAGLGTPTPDDLRGIAAACWELPEREYQYFATDLLVRHADRLPEPFLADVERLITSRSWWDTVDPLASRVVGGLVANHPSLVRVMDAWIEAENVWLVRTALLHQLFYRDATDPDRLFGYCRAQSGHRDFFVRKAIGWALRHYARTDPEAVRRFVAAHSGELSGLSVREAVKNLGKV